jgi:fluoride exporter
MNANIFLAIAAGGALGAIARHLVGHVVTTAHLPNFWAIFTVNVVGSTVGGLLLGLATHIWSPSEALRAFVFVGILGAFTTFSAFSTEMVLFIERGQWNAATAYALASVVLSVGGFLAGLRVMRIILV